MTESRQRGPGSYILSEQQVQSWLSWQDEECLTRNAAALRAELDSASHDFTAEFPWHPNNAQHLADWWETLAKWYALRARAEAKRAERLARVGRVA